MLPIVLVLFVAASAIAAPSVTLNLNSINDIAPARNTGRGNGWIINNALENPDNGDLGAYIITANAIAADMANDPSSQALAVSQTLAILTKVATGIPGDACVGSNLIDACVNANRNGNPKAARSAVANYVNALASELDAIVQLATNPNAARFASGRRGNCSGGGSIYQFEEAWDLARADASPSSAGLIQEQYCAAKRLYNAFSVVSRNVGAAATAAAQRPIVEIVQQCLGPATNFLSAIGNASSQAGQAARGLKQCLLSALNN